MMLELLSVFTIQSFTRICVFVTSAIKRDEREAGGGVTLPSPWTGGWYLYGLFDQGMF